MPEITFNYCGFDSAEDLKLQVNDIKRDIFSEATEQSQEIPGKKGNVFLGMSFGARSFSVDVTTITGTEEERVTLIHELANLFTVSTDNEFPLVFSDDPTVTYYAHVSAMSTPARITQTSSWASFTITFVCSEPMGHYTEKEEQITTNPYVFTPEGEAETYPVFTCIPKIAVNKVGVADENGDYIYLSNGVNEDTQDMPVDKEPVVFTDRMNNLNNWTKLSQATTDFDLLGVVATNTSMRTTQETTSTEVRNGRPYFGDSVDGKWYGPCYQRFLPSSYSDFKIRILLKFDTSYARAKSKMEVYLLDAQSRRIGYITIKDNDNSKTAECIVQIGGVGGVTKKLYQGEGTVVKRKDTTVKKTVKVGTKTVKVKGKSTKEPITKTISLPSDNDTSSFTNFYGYIELEKRGNVYNLRIMKLSDKGQAAWKTGINRKWTDTKNELSSQMRLSGLAIYGAKYNISEDKYEELKNYKNAWMYFCDIKINHIQDGGNASTLQKPIAVLNQEVVLNCDNRICSVDGIPMMEKLFIGSNFIKSDGGIPQTFALTPSTEEADWYVYHVPKTN